MLIRRCAALLLEPRESVEFDLQRLLEGETGVVRRLEWIALAPHLGAEVALEEADVSLLGRVGDSAWVERAGVDREHGAGRVDALLQKGLLVSEGEPSAIRQRDERFRATHWNLLSAASHYFNRWETVDAGEAARRSGLRNTADLAARYGEPPHHFHARCAPVERVPLARPEPDRWEGFLAARTTCRNFELGRALPGDLLARVLQAVFAAVDVVELAPRSAAVKKTSPSGGGLHPTEAYLLIRDVAGVPAGLYHYHSGDHALEPLSVGSLGAEALHALAGRFVAGQHWFADAHVQVILAPRFARSFWKYRNHAKAYRALILDAGHLSQTLYLTATEHGLGAFITAAINEVEIERAFGLDPLDEGPLAICGFGWRADERRTVEFDPQGRIWPGGALPGDAGGG